MKKLEEIKEIHIVPYSHHDHAWTNTRQWHIWRYIEGFCRVLDTMNKHPDYTFVIDNVLHSGELFYKYFPSRADEMLKRTKEGRMAVLNGGKCLIRPTLAGGETFIRNMQAGREVLSELFDPPRLDMYFNADTAIGYSQLPQILKLGGHSHYRFYRPEAALDYAGVPRQFIWKGLDGSEIVASRDIYGGFMFANWAKLEDADWQTKKNDFIDEDLSRRMLYAASSHICLNIGCDDVYPLANLFDEPIDLYGFMEEWNKNEKSLMRMSTPYKFHDAIKEEPLFVMDGPLDPCDVAFNIAVRSDLSLWRARFELEKLITTAEKLGFIQETLGTFTDYKKHRALWDKLLAFSGHAMEWLLDDDYNETLGLVQSARHDAKSLIAEIMDGIASQTNQYGTVQYAVVNTEHFERDELAELHITTPFHVNGLELLDENGNNLPYQVFRLYDGDKAYVNREYNEVMAVCPVKVLPMGVAVVIAKNGGSPMAESIKVSLPEDALLPFDENIVINNGLFTVSLKGGLPVLIKDISENVIYDRKLHGGFADFMFHHTPPERNWGMTYDAIATDGFVAGRVEYTQRGPLRHVLKLNGKLGNKPACISLRIDHNNPRIEFDFTVEHDGAEGYYTAVFPCDEKPNIIAGVPFGAESRNIEEILYTGDCETLPGDGLFDLERGLKGGFFAHSFAAYDFNGRKFSLLQGNCSTFYRSLRASKTIEPIFMRTFDWSKRTERWLKNIHPSFAGEGTQNFSFALCILSSDANLMDIRLEARKAESRLLSAPRYNYEPGGTMTPFSAFKIESGTLCLSAVYAEGDEWVCRMYECAGQPGESKIVTALPLVDAYVSDLCGKAMREGPKRVDEQTYTLSYSPFEIITIRAKRKEDYLCKLSGVGGVTHDFV